MRIVTINMHKGFTAFKRRLMLEDLRHALREADPDVLFLQEVVGRHQRHEETNEDWPPRPQYEYLAEEKWEEFVYGKNAEYPAGHHGNAILSRHVIDLSQTVNVSASHLEQRGILYARMHPWEGGPALHCICIHLGLLKRWRARQLAAIREFIACTVPAGAPLIVAGDFNDWSGKAAKGLAAPLGLVEAFRETHGACARTYPAFCPVLCMDRIYLQGLAVSDAHRLSAGNWRSLSDHVGLLAELELKKEG